jgi:hypothetical protein
VYENRERLFFPRWVDSISTLRVLELYSDLVSHIMDDVSRMTSLERFIIEGSDGSLAKVFGALPTGISSLPHLETLRIIRTNIDIKFDSFQNLVAPLKILDLSFSPQMSSTSSLEDICHQINGPLKLRLLSLRNSPIHGQLNNPCLVKMLPDLELLDLSFTSVAGPLPSQIGNWTQLQELHLEQLANLERISEDIGSLVNLRTLRLQNSAVVGTIPAGLAQLPHLMILNLAYNQLSGTIPRFDSDFGGNSQGLFDFSYNDFVGTLDAFSTSAIGWTLSLYAADNQLEGTIPTSLFKMYALNLASNFFSGNLSLNLLPGPLRLKTLQLQNNQLSGNLPNFTNTPKLDTIMLANNDLTGSLHESLVELIFLNVIDVSSNKRLTSGIPHFIHPYLHSIILDNTQLIGTIPETFENLQGLRNFSASDAYLVGTIPKLPNSLEYFNLKGNSLSGTLHNLFTPPTSMKYCDLSANAFIGFVPTGLLNHPAIEYLDLARNQFTGKLPYIIAQRLRHLSIAENQLDGPIPSVFLLNLEYMSLSNNHLIGDLSFRAPKLSELYLTDNSLSFNANQLEFFPQLSIAKLGNNFIFGGLPYSSKRLTNINLDRNGLNESIDFTKLIAWTKRSLQEELDISRNPLLPVVYNISVIPKILISNTFGTEDREYECIRLGFMGFKYDNRLFDFQQCHCLRNNFGKAPYCFRCASDITCRSYEGVTIEEDDFFFPSKRFFYGPQPGLPVPTTVPVPFYKESCTYWEVGGSNCIATTIPPTLFTYSSTEDEMTAILSAQCRNGSTGRLCSRCICDDPYRDGNQCYFSSSGYCFKCKHVWSLARSIAFVVSIAFIATLALSALMFLVLKSRRKSSSKDWKSLPFLKKFLARASLLIELGFVSIVVNFVQITAELTRWDAFVIRTFGNVLNGDFDGFGIICLFPQLSNPKVMLLVHLLLPFVVSMMFATSIGLAHLAFKILPFLSHLMQSFRSKNGISEDADENHTFEEADIDEHHRLISDNESSDLDKNSSMKLIDTNGKSINDGLTNRSAFEYPTRALLSSLMISIASFFYFSTALSATRYFFNIKQAHTNDLYVLSVPWMKFADASSLRMVSIPFVILVVGGLPLTYFLIMIGIRNRIASSKTTKSYFGSIVGRYKQRFFWWELVYVSRKLLVALFRRSFSINNAWQTGSIVTVLGMALIAQSTLRPWKRKSENVVDTVSGLLLIVNVIVNPLSSMLFSKDVLYMVLILDAVFVVGIVVLIVFHSLTGTTEYEKRWNALHTESIDSEFYSSNDIGTGKPSLAKHLLLDQVEKDGSEDDYSNVESDSNVGM